ncbi:hypothetical protein BDR26DRAFT_892510 [Obelidium mucronatum]|nr:hypothetical protein BDR26DRAFT_892510 [Obelidium mucronatum]
MKQFYRRIAAILAILFLTQHVIVAATAWDEKAIAQQEFAESKQPGKASLDAKDHPRPACQNKYAGEWDSPMGAQMTIVDRVWAAANGIKRLARVAMTAIGFDNIPRQVMMDISEPMELANPSGQATVINVILGHNPNEIITLGMDAMPDMGIALTGLSASGDTPAPLPFATTPEQAISLPKHEQLSDEDARARQDLLNEIQPYLDENAKILPWAKTNIPGATVNIDLVDHAEPSRIRQKRLTSNWQPGSRKEVSKRWMDRQTGMRQS